MDRQTDVEGFINFYKQNLKKEKANVKLSSSGVQLNLSFLNPSLLQLSILAKQPLAMEVLLVPARCGLCVVIRF